MRSDISGWVFIARGDVRHQTQRVMHKRRSGISASRADDVDQVVRRAGERGGIRLGRADVHVAKHQRGIHADEFNRKVLHQFYRDAGLAAGGGPYARWRESVSTPQRHRDTEKSG
jgi:hypothetical protein